VSPMDILEAIETAIRYETRVRDVYARAAARVTSTAAKRAMEFMAREEGYHKEYLEAQRKKWAEEGILDHRGLKSTAPSTETIRKEVSKLEGHMKKDVPGEELQMLQRALEVEKETSDFYRKLVDQVEGDARKLFARFLEIEEGHLNLVQAEIDALQGMGMWFDCPEFNLEAE